MNTGIILAAGRSSRMGSSKALLELGGETFLTRIVEALRRGGCDDIIVVVRPQEGDNPAIEISRRAATLGARTAVNPDQSSGQIDSLRAALRLLPEHTRFILSTPVDAPGLSAEIVRDLITAGGAEGTEIVIPTYQGRRGHPVLFSSRLIGELQDPLLPEGARSVIHRDPARVRELAVYSAAVLLDIDTPADYERLRMQQG